MQNCQDKIVVKNLWERKEILCPKADKRIPQRDLEMTNIGPLSVQVATNCSNSIERTPGDGRLQASRTAGCVRAVAHSWRAL